MEDEESLETRARVGETPEAVEDGVDQLLADLVRACSVSAGTSLRAGKRDTRKTSTHGVVSTRVVVGSILLARDEGLGVEEGAVGSRADLVDDSRLQVNVD